MEDPLDAASSKWSEYKEKRHGSDSRRSSSRNYLHSSIGEAFKKERSETILFQVIEENKIESEKKFVVDGATLPQDVVFAIFKHCRKRLAKMRAGHSKKGSFF